MPYDLLQDGQTPLTMMVQQSGEKPDAWSRKAFVCTADEPEVDAITRDFPQRWRIEEFFNTYQELGWRRAGTQNLHIRYGRMTLALIAQATTHMLRQRLDETTAAWDAPHLAAEVLGGMEGDIRVRGDTILVTYYNAPMVDQLRTKYEKLPDRLAAENVNPKIPWLYDLKLDFRFR